MRRLGVEIEFGGLELEAIGEIVRECFGGTVELVSPYECRVGESELGTFAIELDFQYLKVAGREAAEGPGEDLPMRRVGDELLGAVARHIVPFEIVGPPVPMDRIGRLETLVERLREAGALGTRHSPVYAFGLHMNPEMPDLEAPTIAAYLKTFLCLHDWLLRVGRIDWTRRVTPYINAFPGAYVRRVIDRDYWPDLDALMDDYLEHNADRNRALDCLPLLAHLDEPRVRRAIDDPRIKPRPALHYRLPNCDVDDPGWSLRVPWVQWLQVEHLAADRERLERVCRAYSRHLAGPLGGMLGDWPTACERWLKPERDL